MFRKLFLSFWLTVVVVTVALEALTLYQRHLERQSRVRSAALVANSRGVADAYERGVRATSFDAANILDAGGDSIVGRSVSNAERDAAAMAARIYASGFGDSWGRDGVVAVHFFAASGHPFTAIARARSNFLFMRYVAWIAVLVAGTIACFAVARHFSKPLVQLGAAANAVADGRLQTRVGPQLTARRDEIGSLARDFDRMTEQIESLVAAARRTLADASHELRSPLARLNVALSLARHDPEHLDRVQREAERLDKLIAELLTLARIDSGAEAAAERFDLRELLQEIVADGDFEARAAGRRVELIAGEACPIDGAAELMRSAIENVVRNAIRHTRGGTAVEVALRCEDRALLTIRDHGPGVPEASLAEIFQPFRRIDDTADGAGLGLAIAERVVRRHGGTIRAANADGGMLVVIELPIVDRSTDRAR